MNLELVVALFAFAVPGALAVLAWDWSVRRRDRSLAQTLGFGIIVSLPVYAALEAATSVRLTNLLDRDGKLALARLLSHDNLYLFFAVSLVLTLLGLVAGRLLPPLIARRTGWSPHASVWGEVMWMVARGDREPDRAWLTVRTKTGLEFHGRPYNLPDAPPIGDFISLREATGREKGSTTWAEQEPIILIPYADIEVIAVNCPGAPEYEQRRQRREQASIDGPPGGPSEGDVRGEPRLLVATDLRGEGHDGRDSVHDARGPSELRPPSAARGSPWRRADVGAAHPPAELAGQEVVRRRRVETAPADFGED